MDDLSQLPLRAQGELLRALESAVSIRHRGELFLWAQGPLQALIPHGLMLCLVFNAEHQVVHADCLHAVVIDPLVLDALRHPQTGLVARVAQRCRELGQWACQLSGAAFDPTVSPVSVGEGGDQPVDSAGSVGVWGDLAQEWTGLGLGHALFQGSGPLAGGVASFFALLCVPQAPQAQQVLLLQVLLPQLHMALSRSQHYSTPAVSAEVENIDLSERQLEILHWVKRGKTNHEIALILAISELTVKNHMQKLFKKLNVHNRAQAVARVMSLSLD
jgi:transcriptional regulator EpsA